jgi:hypothetical protein
MDGFTRTIHSLLKEFLVMKKTVKASAAFRWIAVIAALASVCAACITQSSASGSRLQYPTEATAGGAMRNYSEVAADAGTQAKYALVIGNGNYTALSKLRNPVNDAEDVAAALSELGFNVDKVLDGDLNTMESAIINLKYRLANSKNTYGFFFYAGHGVQSNGVNYLVPVSANIPSEGFLRERALSVQAMLSELNDAGNELNVVVLDACRDNPFSWGRNSGRGLTVIANQPADSIVVYATSAGSIAQDGLGRNGLFTSSLLNNLKTPGLEVKEIFNRTGADVLIASDRKQIPAVYSQFFGNAYFSKPLVVPPIEAPQTAVVPSQPTETPSAAAVPSQPTVTPQPQASAAPVASSVSITGSRSESGAGVTFTNVADFRVWLAKQPDNNVSVPYNVKLNVKSLNWIKDILRDAPKKYVYLDLSGSTFTSIDNYTFEGCGSLASITMPNSVTSIGFDAFRGCINLTNVIIPDNVISIGNSAFSYCDSLVSINISNSLPSIGNNVFRSCISLVSVTIPNSVTSIEQEAFQDCSKLLSVTIPSSVTSIGRYAFSDCTNLNNVTFQGTIPSSGFYSGIFSVFPGDLRAKFYATDKTKGTPGTYTRASGSKTWTRL